MLNAASYRGLQMRDSIYASISNGRAEQSHVAGRIALRWWRTVFTVLFAGLFAVQANAVDPVLVNVDVGNPPFAYNKEGGKIAQGIYPALLKAAFDRLGTPLKLQSFPWKRALLEIDRGIAGVGGIYKNEVRLLKYDYSDPMFVERIAVYYNKHNPIEYNSIEDLYGKRVGVMLGWSYGDDFDLARTYDQIIVEPVIDVEQNFEKLSRGRIDAVLAIVESGEHMLARGKHHDLVMANTLLLATPGYLAFLKRANQLKLIERFNKELAEMKKDGTLDRIVRQELSR